LSSPFKIRVAEPNITEEDAQAVYNAVKEECLSGSGPYNKQFEEKFAKFIGTKYAITVNSGTAALHLSLEALGIRDGDEVITTPFTFAATSNVIVMQNARPVFSDIEPETFNLDPTKIEKAITPNTKAIMPIHYAGQVCEMDEINEIAQKHSLYVIEDAAPAAGATYKGKRAGTLGDIAGFSFFPDKNMTTGEGGMIVTDNSELAEKCQILKKNGASKRYYNIFMGWNFKMPDINAALGISQLKRIESIIETKILRAKNYDELLKSVEEIKTPLVLDYNKSTYMLYSILAKNEQIREKIRIGLENEGIETRINFPSMHLQPVYEEKYGNMEGKFPISEDVSKRILGLPIYINMTETEQKLVSDTIKNILK
jgi:dTDP-4-amino-4,6-dideoxygalactose transaminase|tara:strand:- start:6757 stop:7866 length:1110 start_codon:yes stop_codon:yes gene_type:complete